MKTAITSTGNDPASLFDMRFGRAAWICIYDGEKEEVAFFENVTNNTSHDVGTSIAKKLIDTGIKRIISGDFGPKAREVLRKANVQMVIIQNSGQTIHEIIEKLKK